MEQIIRKRGSLENLKKAIENKNARIGFIGGSITDAKNGNNWPYRVTGFLLEAYPDVKFTIDNVAIGATGSVNGLTRVDKDLIAKKCDVVFVEYAVNDYRLDEDEEKCRYRRRTREGLIRKLLKANIDVVIVYTYCKEFLDAMAKGEMPVSIKDLEELAVHYNIPSVWMSLRAFRMMENGMFSMQQWLPDGLHPQEMGGLIYASAVWDYLKEELASENNEKILKGENMPAPTDPLCWEETEFVSVDELETKGPWYKLRETGVFWYDYCLLTTSTKASLTYKFKGRGLLISLNYGKLTGKICYRIDGGEEKAHEGIHDDWVKDSGWPLVLVLGENLDGDKEHTLELWLEKSALPKAFGTELKINGMTVIK